MSEKYEQKVKIVIKESFESSLLHKYLEDDRGEMNFDSEYNKAWLSIVIGRHGKPVNCFITKDMQFAVDGDPFGYDGYIMVDYCFVEMDNVKPIGNIYFTGKIYKLIGDETETMGVYVSMNFNKDKGIVEYVLMTFDKGAVTGEIMTELNDEELDLYKLGNRKDYYAEA